MPRHEERHNAGATLPSRHRPSSHRHNTDGRHNNDSRASSNTQSRPSASQLPVRHANVHSDNPASTHRAHFNQIRADARPPSSRAEDCDRNPHPDPHGRYLHLWVGVKASHYIQGLRCPRCQGVRTDGSVQDRPADVWYECYWCRKKVCDTCAGKVSGYVASTELVNEYNRTVLGAGSRR